MASRRRLSAVLNHLVRACPTVAVEDDDNLPLLSWDIISRHSMPKDAWVAINGIVYDITAFIADDGADSGHPGGQEIPLEYAGKDATEFWMDMHGHVEEDILAAIASGDGDDLGLEFVPTVVGRADGEPPAASRGPGFPSTNWAGNVVWRANVVASPESLDELVEVVSAASGEVRCVGRSHSFTPVCDTDGLLLSLARMQNILEFDDDIGRVTVEGGTTYTVLNTFLKDTQWALQNLATLPHFTVAGSMSMGTHGSSGVDQDGRAQLGNQASQVVAIEFVLADGSLKAYSRSGDPEIFDGLCVSLGCLGVVSKLTLQLVPRYHVHQAVYTHFTVTDVIANFRVMINNVDSFSWIVDWPTGDDEPRSRDFHNRLLVRKFISAAHPPEHGEHIYPEEQWGGRKISDERGPWYQMMHTGQPSGIEEDLNAYGSGGSYETREVQVEYFIDLALAEEALVIIADVCGKWGYDIFQITELRVTRGDELWLSPVRDRDSLVVHFSMNKFNIAGVMAAAAELEAALAHLAPRAHWGKLHAMGADVLEERYGAEAIAKFRALADEHDPAGVFRNDWFERLVFGDKRDHRELVLEATPANSTAVAEAAAADSQSD